MGRHDEGGQRGKTFETRNRQSGRGLVCSSVYSPARILLGHVGRTGEMYDRPESSPVGSRPKAVEEKEDAMKKCSRESDLRDIGELLSDSV